MDSRAAHADNQYTTVSTTVAEIDGVLRILPAPLEGVALSRGQDEAPRELRRWRSQRNGGRHHTNGRDNSNDV